MSDNERMGAPDRIVRIIAAIATVSASACVRQLPPRATPDPVAPQVDTSTPIPEGHGRLVVDVVDGPVSVQRVQMEGQPSTNAQGRPTFRFVEVPHTLCSSPCVADVPQGNMLLGFPVIGSNRLDVELVHVGPDPSVYRRSLSIYTDNHRGARILGIISTSVGGAALITGISLLSIGLGKDLDGMTAAGGITLGAGVVLTTAGILMIRRFAATYKPGAANHFDF
jgi:hypothetical protein